MGSEFEPGEEAFLASMLMAQQGVMDLEVRKNSV